jgi:GT2 family glycosyltransferase
MIDNDTLPNFRILDFIEAAEREAKFVAGAPTPMMGDGALNWNVAHKRATDELIADFYNTLPAAGWNRCDYVGGAFLAVRRPVFEAIKGNWFDRLPNKSEDFSFCHRVGEAGFQPWFSAEHRCSHFHSCDITRLMKGAVQ